MRMNTDEYLSDLDYCLSVLERYLPAQQRAVSDPETPSLDPRVRTDDSAALREIKERSAVHIRALLTIINTLHHYLNDCVKKYGDGPEYTQLLSNHERLAQAYSDMVDKASAIGVLGDLQKKVSQSTTPQSASQDGETADNK